MTELLASILRGLGNGSAYALLALGFVIIYKSTRVISFAQPALLLAGAVLVSYLSPVLGFGVGVVMGAVAIAMLALTVERSTIRPMVGRPVFVIVIITVGVDVVIRVVTGAFIGTDVRQVGDPWGFATIALGDVLVEQRHVAMLVTTAVVVAALSVFFTRSRLGLGMRAAALDQESAVAQGVSPAAVLRTSWAIAGVLAVLAGVLVSTGGGIDAQLYIIAFKALPAIILGGLDSLAGAVVGGLAVGVVESLVATYQGDIAPWLGPNFAIVSPYVLMLLVLMVRPYGIFGTRDVERV